MGDFELIFEVCAPTDGQTESLYAAEDALLSIHGRTTLVTLTSEGPSALAAAKAAIGRLETLGITVCRFYEDLVTRTEVARRAGVTPQAVGLWVRNERHSGGAPPFPEPYNYASGSSELWVWRDVNEWLGFVGKADDLMHPARVDYVLINEWLLARSASLRTERLGAMTVAAKVSRATVGVKMSTAQSGLTFELAVP